MNSVDLNRDSPYFDKLISVTVIKSPNDVQIIDLTFRIIGGTRATKQSGQNERLIHFEFADENNPFFLYVLEVGEQDFHQLKREQSILVEFNVFPSKLIELIELSMEKPSTQLSLSSSLSDKIAQSTFTVNLDETSGILSIVESNMFKQLTHISLQLRLGNDHAIKTYLASRLQYTSKVASSLHEELQGTRSSLKNEMNKSRQLNDELLQLRMIKEGDLSQLQLKHTDEISRIQLESYQEIDKLKCIHDEIVKSLHGQLDHIRHESSIKIQVLETQLSEMTHNKTELEYQCRDFLNTTSTLTQERDKALESNIMLKEENRRYEEIINTLEKEVVKCTGKIEALQSQLVDKDELINKTMALLHATEANQVSLEDKLKLYIHNNDVYQERLHENTIEIQKYKQTIESLQEDIKAMKDKVKVKSEVIRKQENVVTELRTSLSTTEKDYHIMKHNHESMKLQVQLMTSQVEDTKQKLLDSVKLEASNQEIIAFLNKELSKWQLGMQDGPPPPGANSALHKNIYKDTRSKSEILPKYSTDNYKYSGKIHYPVNATDTHINTSKQLFTMSNEDIFNYTNQLLATASPAVMKSTVPGTGHTRGNGQDYIDSYGNVPAISSQARVTPPYDSTGIDLIYSNSNPSKIVSLKPVSYNTDISNTQYNATTTNNSSYNSNSNSNSNNNDMNNAMNNSTNNRNSPGKTMTGNRNDNDNNNNYINEDEDISYMNNISMNTTINNTIAASNTKMPLPRQDMNIYKQGLMNLGLDHESFSGLEELDVIEQPLLPVHPNTYYSTAVTNTSHPNTRTSPIANNKLINNTYHNAASSGNYTTYPTSKLSIQEEDSSFQPTSHMDVLDMMDYYATTPITSTHLPLYSRPPQQKTTSSGKDMLNTVTPTDEDNLKSNESRKPYDWRNMDQIRTSYITS